MVEEAQKSLGFVGFLRTPTYLLATKGHFNAGDEESYSHSRNSFIKGTFDDSLHQRTRAIRNPDSCTSSCRLVNQSSRRRATPIIFTASGRPNFTASLLRVLSSGRHSSGTRLDSRVPSLARSSKYRRNCRRTTLRFQLF